MDSGHHHPKFAAPLRPQSRLSFKPRLERLEERDCPSGGPIPDSGGGNPTVWKPVDPGNLASDKNNWSTKQVPTGGIPAYFDGTVSNAYIVWDQSLTPGQIVLQGGYTGLETINSGITIKSANGINMAGSDNGASEQLNVDFQTTTSTLEMDGGTTTLANFNFSDQNGLFLINSGASVVMGGSPNAITNYSQQTNANFEVASSGSLEITYSQTGTQAAVVLANGANLTVDTGGQMTVDANINGTVLDDNGQGGIITNNGTENVTGGAGGKAVNINMAVKNTGTYNVNGGLVNFNTASPKTNNDDFYQTAGVFNLNTGASVSMAHAYGQSGGTLQTGDRNSCSLDIAGGKGTATITGSKIVLGADGSYGKLLITGGLALNGGEYDAKINGNAGASNDTLQVIGAVTIGANAKLVVTSKVAVVKNQLWSIISCSVGNMPDFAAANKTLPQGIISAGPGAPPDQDRYLLKS